MDRDERNMKAMGSCSRVVVGLIFVFCASSCAQVIGADDYRLAQGGGTGGAPGPGADGGHEVVAPFLTAPACVSCAEGACAAELDRCNSSDECLRWLAGVRANKSPASAYLRDQAVDETVWLRD